MTGGRGRGYSLLALTACALCACATPSSPSAFNAALQRAATSLARRTPPLHRDRRRSWFSPDAATKAPLLFVSDSGTADVYIYKLPSLKVVATITGFSQPQGECSDNKGNVWIADTNARTLYELSHHGHLVDELTDSTGYPVACAWDPTTHDLAVINLFGSGSTAGAVLVYANGSGTPAVYTNPAVNDYYFAGYDASGDLFFDGLDDSGNFLLSELAKGASSAQTISLNGGTIYYPGMVEWNSKKRDLVIGDQACGNAYVSCVYSVTISKSGGQIGPKTALQNSAGQPLCDLVQGALLRQSNSEIAGSDFDFCGSVSSATYLWPYPGGGPATAHNSSTDSAPVGAAISRSPAAPAAAQTLRFGPKPRSYMKPDAKSEDLLYVSNSNGEVGVYRYWQHTLVGLLTNFTSPIGQCVDANQNVYITDAAAQKILEYAHAGTKPIKTYDDAPDSPYACWVDPTSGNLAVANDDGASQAGNIAIWNATSGNRSTYTDAKLFDFQGCAYDNEGNLFVTNGYVAYPNYTYFAWLPKNGNKLIDINVPGPKGSWKWGGVKGVQWDGKYFAIDAGYIIYRESLLHGQAYYVGETGASAEDEGNASPYAFYDSGNGQATQVVEGMQSDEAPNEVAYWHYPAGGDPIATITHAIYKPVGVAISLKK